MHKFGNLTIQRQTGADLEYRADGLIQGSLTVELDTSSSLSNAKALIGSKHPDDAAVMLYAGRLTFGRLGKASFTFDCMGLMTDPTRRVAVIRGQVSTTPIEAHPRFTSTLAGTIDNPLNGAIFDEEDGSFVGFGAGLLLGTTSFYDGGPVIKATYYTRKPPSFTKAFTITAALPNIPHVAGVTKWLYMPPESEEVPNTGIFKVCEEFQGIAPSGEAGADLIYGD